MTNQTRVYRKWLSYSLHLNKMYYVICLCYTDRTSPFNKGLSPSAKHIYNQVELHEKSDIHGTALMAYLLQSKNQCTESKLKKNHSVEVAQRRLVLQRVIDIIIFIGTHGLVFRGKHEAANSLNDNKNHGNFLSLVLLLAKYDPVLGQHVDESIKSSTKRKDTHQNNKGSGNLVTFLSKTTINK